MKWFPSTPGMTGRNNQQGLVSLNSVPTALFRPIKRSVSSIDKFVDAAVAGGHNRCDTNAQGDEWLHAAGVVLNTRRFNCFL